MSKLPGACASTDDDQFAARFDSLLRSGAPFSLTIPRAAFDAFRLVGESLRRHRIRVVMSADSQPEAIDYVSQTVLGASVGRVGGAISGITVLGILARAGVAILVPGIGWWLGGATLVGCVIGAMAGYGVTHMGLRIRFVQDNVLLDFVPQRD